MKAIFQQPPLNFLFADYARKFARLFESEYRMIITEHCDLRHCRMVHADEILPVH